jgi:hypothetical protein
MNTRGAFAWGCLGAVAPEILRFFKIVSNGQNLPDMHWPVYSLLLVFYVLLAGFVSIAFKPDSAWKGLWVGASLPALIATLVQTAPTLAKA